MALIKVIRFFSRDLKNKMFFIVAAASFASEEKLNVLIVYLIFIWKRKCQRINDFFRISCLFDHERVLSNWSYRFIYALKWYQSEV